MFVYLHKGSIDLIKDCFPLLVKCFRKKQLRTWLSWFKTKQDRSDYGASVDELKNSINIFIKAFPTKNRSKEFKSWLHFSDKITECKIKDKINLNFIKLILESPASPFSPLAP